MNQKELFRIKLFSVLLILLTLSFLAGCGSESATRGSASPTPSQGKPATTTPGVQFLTTHSFTSVKWQNGSPEAHGVINPGNGGGCPAAGKRVSPPPQVAPSIQATQTVVFVAPAEVCGRMNVLWHDCDRATYAKLGTVINSNKCKEYPDPRNAQVMVAEQDVMYTDAQVTGTGSSYGHSFFQLILCDQFGNVGTYQAYGSPS